MNKGDAGAHAVHRVGFAAGSPLYTTAVQNTTDTSERLRIIHSAEGNGWAQATHTWINVTTGTTRAQLVNLPGSVVLNYDITGPAGLVTSTAVEVYLTDDGNNDTDHAAGALTLVSSGNARSGVVDLDDGVQKLADRDETAAQTWSGATHAGTEFVHLAFKMTHAAGNDLSSDADYAIAADFCNFDTTNSSGLVHNCTYRIEAEETGDDTGIFEGTVEYIVMNNSTDNTAAGAHAGNNEGVEGLLTDMGQDGHALVVLQDSVDGSDAIRVTYNDTDALQVATEIAAQLDTCLLYTSPSPRDRA